MNCCTKNYLKRFFAFVLVFMLTIRSCEGFSTSKNENILAATNENGDVVKVACVGDSITEGLCSTEGQSYPTQLQEILGSDFEVKNFGVSGRTLLKKGDYPYWNESAYTESKNFLPDVVIIMLGTNDTKPQN